MEITASERQREEVRLQAVLADIQVQLEAVRRRLQEQGREIRTLRRETWQDAPQIIHSFDDVIELAQQNQVLGEEERSLQATVLAARRLERMADSPYFGRIDVRIEGEEVVEEIYIGIATLRDEVSGDLLIHDWRAPVSSLFYDAEPGKATYRGAAGPVVCELLRKRQYRIQRGVLTGLFDTDLKIDDEILQEMLSRQTDGRMRTIVYSIQREQNRVIRDEDHDLLMVQGPAGSGKTSIALHRVAYLLYRYRETLEGDQIVILSPNPIFSDYISEVLPELGEENVRQTTFEQYAREQLGTGLQLEDRYEQVEALLADSAETTTRRAVVAYKGTRSFAQTLEAYIGRLEEEIGRTFEPVAFEGALVVSKEDLRKLFHEKYSFLPLGRRLQKLRQRIEFMLEPLVAEKVKRLTEQLAEESRHSDKNSREVKALARTQVHEELQPLRARVERFARIDLLGLYTRLFEDRKCFATATQGDSPPIDIVALQRHTLEPLRQGRVPYEDTPALLFLKLALQGTPSGARIRHVVVDEAQDYSPLQYKVIQGLAPNATFTVLGDVDQSLEPHVLPDHYEAVAAALSKRRSAFIRLAKSYRSTREIARFTRALLKRPVNVEVVQRSGLKPRLIHRESVEQHRQAVVQGVKEARQKGYTSLAVICKTHRESEEVHATLKDRFRVHLVTKDDVTFWHGTVIIPVYLAKGLEFDAVLVHDVSKAKYGQAHDRRWLYVACTRALHALELYCLGEPSPWVAGVGADLFDGSAG